MPKPVDTHEKIQQQCHDIENDNTHYASSHLPSTKDLSKRRCLFIGDIWKDGMIIISVQETYCVTSIESK